MSTVDPVQTTTYDLSTSNNPITFGSGTDIDVSNGNGVYGGLVSGGLLTRWNVTNAGTIIGQQAGIFLNGAYPVTVANLAGGTISAEIDGVYIQGAGTVTNAGTISADYGISIQGDGTVTNAGKISAGIGVTDNGSLFLTNERGGSIYGVYWGVYGVGSGTVTNDSGGTISSGARFWGVYLNTLSGEYSTVTNGGTITGRDSVYFKGGGTNTLILKTGSTLNGAAVGSTDSGATNAFVLEGTGTANNDFANFNTLTVKKNASWALGGSSTLGGASSSFGEATIDSGALLDFDGATTIAGKVGGAGTLELGGGSTTLDSGAKLPVAHWTVSGSGTSVTLDENLTYTGAFSAGGDATLDLSGGALTLTGTDSFAGATLSGSHNLNAKGTTAVSDLTIGGTTAFNDTNAVTESGGSATVGDAAGDVAKLTIAAGAAWDILDDSGIGLGASTSSSISNSGLFEKTLGAGTSAIAPKFVNDATALVTTGTLDFEKAVTGTGTDTMFGGTTLEFDSAVSSSAKVGAQNIGFSGGGTLDLTDPKGFWGDISGFAKNDAIDLLGSWSLSSFSEVSGIGELTLKSGTAKHTFDFVGDFTASSFNIASGATTVITHT